MQQSPFQSSEYYVLISIVFDQRRMITAFKLKADRNLKWKICDYFCFRFRDRLGIVITDLLSKSSSAQRQAGRRDGGKSAGARPLSGLDA